MTDEQWLWLFANQNLDVEERIEGMCPDCRREVTQETHCVRCGKRISSNIDGEGEDCETVINENFDMARYEAMKNGTYVPDIHREIEPETDDEPTWDDVKDEDGEIDMDLINQILSNKAGD